jgi:hypothetical protein
MASELLTAPKRCSGTRSSLVTRELKRLSYDWILPAASGRNFIGYRREDTAYPAGWLYDGLAEHSAAARSSRTLTPSSRAFNDQSRLSAVDLAQIA